MIVAGDGRYYNEEAMQRIFLVLAGNGVSNIWVPQGGIMSTPAVSAAIRTRENGRAQGGIILTASHNPGGPGEDFGIKYNEALGQPAGEEFTDSVSSSIAHEKDYMMFCVRLNFITLVGTFSLHKVIREEFGHIILQVYRRRIKCRFECRRRDLH